MPEYHERKQNRLQNYDYSQKGAYHVILCSLRQERIFSEIIMLENGDVSLNLLLSGKEISGGIDELETRYPWIHVVDYCIMPNHVHLLLYFQDSIEGKRLSTVINQLKGAVRKRVGYPIWEKGYYDHIIRGEEDFVLTRKYIQENPMKWAEDKYYCP